MRRGRGGEGERMKGGRWKENGRRIKEREGERRNGGWEEDGRVRVRGWWG